jgi:CO/xanthine dehydrogenase FAD-binding subunit
VPVRLVVPAELPADASGESWPRRVAEGAAAVADIEAGESVSAEYRRELVAALAEDALRDAMERAR